MAGYEVPAPRRRQMTTTEIWNIFATFSSPTEPSTVNNFRFRNVESKPHHRSIKIEVECHHCRRRNWRNGGGYGVRTAGS